MGHMMRLGIVEGITMAHAIAILPLSIAVMFWPQLWITLASAVVTVAVGVPCVRSMRQG